MKSQRSGSGTRVNPKPRNGPGRPPDFSRWGIRYPDYASAKEAVGLNPSDISDYVEPFSPVEIHVLKYDRADGSKRCRYVTKFQDGWYIGLPDPPYPLHAKSELVEAETVYVCDSEETTDDGFNIRLCPTTSLLAPLQPELSDWSPLEDKHVVILQSCGEAGWRYADQVAQLALAAGALSAKIVTFPGLKDGEGLHEWIFNREDVCDWGAELVAIRAEIDVMAAAAVPVQRIHQKNSHGKGELARAIDWLTTRLANEPVRSTTLKEEAEQNQFSDSTLRRAYHWLDGHANRQLVTNHWYWSLPGCEVGAQGAQDVQTVEQVENDENKLENG